MAHQTCPYSCSALPQKAGLLPSGRCSAGHCLCWRLLLGAVVCTGLPTVLQMMQACDLTR